MSEAPLGSILDLLKEKKIISDEESAAFIRRMVYKSLAREDLKALVDLLREKGVMNGEEAAGFIQNIGRTPVSAAGMEPSTTRSESVQAENGLVLPEGDRVLKGQLRDLWVKKGNRKVDFDRQFGEIRDPGEIIGRMRVMGVITPSYAEKLDSFYREKYLSGAVSTAMENKENDYIQRIRNDVSWEIDDKIKDKLKGEWWQNIRLSGDFRLRYQGDFFDGNNSELFFQPSDPTKLMNSRDNRHRVRLRFRLGLEARLFDGLEAGAGISTGTTGSLSPNTTMGDSFMNKNIVLNKAFLKWSPLPELNFWGGRFENPFFYTDLVWYPDLFFDGIAVQYRPQLTSEWSLFVNAGAFPLQEVELSSHDKWLFGGQAGAQFRRGDRLSAKLGVAFYDFENIVGVANDPAQPGLKDFTAPQYQQKGNTLMDIDPTDNGSDNTGIKTAYASEFRELNITGSLDIGFWHPAHVILIGDYVYNFGFKRKDVNARTGKDVKKDVKGFQLGTIVGYPSVKDFAEWKVLLFYKYLESDAVMDAYTDQDFHLGGTNAKGWIVGGDFGLYKNVWLSARWLTANEISGPPLGIDVFQFNLNAKF
jgi:hypothetical protein